jgi:hypothetical protein
MSFGLPLGILQNSRTGMGDTIMACIEEDAMADDGDAQNQFYK